MRNLNAMAPAELRAELISARADKLRLERQMGLLRRNASALCDRMKAALETSGAVRTAMIAAIREQGPIVVSFAEIHRVTPQDELKTETITSAGADGQQPGLKLVVTAKPAPEKQG